MHWAITFLVGTFFYCWTYSFDIVKWYYEGFETAAVAATNDDDHDHDHDHDQDAFKSIAIPPFWLTWASAAILFQHVAVMLNGE